VKKLILSIAMVLFIAGEAHAYTGEQMAYATTVQTQLAQSGIYHELEHILGVLTRTGFFD
jgi:hypothetical protein